LPSRADRQDGAGEGRDARIPPMSTANRPGRDARRRNPPARPASAGRRGRVLRPGPARGAQPRRPSAGSGVRADFEFDETSQLPGFVL